MKVGIVGAGMVGGATANALVLTRVADEIALVDAQPERAITEAEDVLHATPFAHNALVRAAINGDVRRAAYRIIQGKGATWCGIARIVRAIGGDERAVLTVSVVVERLGAVGPVALSLPRVVGRTGVLRTLDPRLDAEERGLLERSAAALREAAGGRW